MIPRVKLTTRKMMAFGTGLGAVCGLVTFLVQPHPTSAKPKTAVGQHTQAKTSSNHSTGNSSNRSSNASGNQSSSNSAVAATAQSASQTAQQNQVLAAIRSLVRSSSSVDASAFVQSAFLQAGVSLPRTVQAQCQSGSEVSSASALEPGDIVCFDLTNNPPQTPTFDGVYIGNGQFAALTTHGAEYISMSNTYWSGKFLYGRRIL